MNGILNNSLKSRPREIEEFSGGIAMANEVNKQQTPQLAVPPARPRSPELRKKELKRKRYVWTSNRRDHYDAFRSALEMQDDKWDGVRQRHQYRPISRKELKGIAWNCEGNRRVLDLVYEEIEASVLVSTTAEAYKGAWYELASFCDLHEQVLNESIYKQLKREQVKGTPLYYLFHHGLGSYRRVFDNMNAVDDTNEIPSRDFLSEEPEDSIGSELTSEQTNEMEVNPKTKAGHSWTVRQESEFDAFREVFGKEEVLGAWKKFAERYPVRPKDIEDIDKCEFRLTGNRSVLKRIYIWLMGTGLGPMRRAARQNGLFKFVCFCDWYELPANQENFKRLFNNGNPAFVRMRSACGSKTVLPEFGADENSGSLQPLQPLQPERSGGLFSEQREITQIESSPLQNSPSLGFEGSRVAAEMGYSESAGYLGFRNQPAEFSGVGRAATYDDERLPLQSTTSTKPPQTTEMGYEASARYLGFNKDLSD